MIQGANLGAIWVKFSGVLGHISRSSATTIIAVVPKRAHTGKLTVRTRGGTGLSVNRYKVLSASA